MKSNSSLTVKEEQHKSVNFQNCYVPYCSCQLSYNLTYIEETKHVPWTGARLHISLLMYYFGNEWQALSQFSAENVKYPVDSNMTIELSRKRYILVQRND